LGRSILPRRRSGARDYGWSIVEDAGRGYRRVVASPEPREIVEIERICSLVRSGHTVIAAGGGGIPVVRHDGRLIGVEAVVDKALTSALLAQLLGVDLLIISTDTEYVYLNYKRPDRRAGTNRRIGGPGVLRCGALSADARLSKTRALTRTALKFIP